MAELPDDVDLLVHEGTYPSDMDDLALERGHSTWNQAVNMAILSNCKQLIITHLSPRFTNSVIKNELLELREIYENIDIAQNGMTYVIPLIK